MKYKASESAKGTAILHAARTPNLSLSPLAAEGDVTLDLTLTGILSDPKTNVGIPNKTIHLIVDGNDTGKTATTSADGSYTFHETYTNNTEIDQTFEYYMLFNGD